MLTLILSLRYDVQGTAQNAAMASPGSRTCTVTGISAWALSAPALWEQCHKRVAVVNLLPSARKKDRHWLICGAADISSFHPEKHRPSWLHPAALTSSGSQPAANRALRTFAACNRSRSTMRNDKSTNAEILPPGLSVQGCATPLCLCQRWPSLMS
jgi:hypothetical protein